MEQLNKQLADISSNGIPILGTTGTVCILIASLGVGAYIWWTYKETSPKSSECTMASPPSPFPSNRSSESSILTTPQMKNVTTPQTKDVTTQTDKVVSKEVGVETGIETEISSFMVMSGEPKIRRRQKRDSRVPDLWFDPQKQDGKIGTQAPREDETRVVIPQGDDHKRSQGGSIIQPSEANPFPDSSKVKGLSTFLTDFLSDEDSIAPPSFRSLLSFPLSPFIWRAREQRECNDEEESAKLGATRAYPNEDIDRIQKEYELARLKASADHEKNKLANGRGEGGGGDGDGGGGGGGWGGGGGGGGYE